LLMIYLRSRRLAVGARGASSARQIASIALNLGKTIKSITYVLGPYSIKTSADVCIELKTFFGIATNGTLNLLYGYDL
jgi:hypothetical protein